MQTQILELRTLGSFELYRQGRPVRLERTKHKALVAYLCLNKGRSFNRAQLSDLLWEQSCEGKAKHSLSQALYALRRIIPELLLVRRESIACNADVVTTDVEAVSILLREGSLERALATMKGNFLEDVDVRGASEFESWKSDFNRHFYDRTEKMVKASIQELSIKQQRLLEIPPHVVSYLPNVRFMFSDDDEEERLPVAVGEDERMLLRPQFRLPFTGRDQHIAALAQSLASCINGNPTFAVITGYAGHGKTRLVEEFLSTAKNARIFRAKCYEAERRVGFGPIIDLLSNCFSQHDLDRLQPIWHQVLRELAPDRFSEGPEPPELSGLAGQRRVFEAVLQALTVAADDEPVIVFIDDVQWADKSTRALLSYLTHRIEASPIMLLGALRTKSGADLLGSPWREWATVEVAELSPNQATEIVESVLRNQHFQHQSSSEIINLTGGHPYLLYEVLGRVAAGDRTDLRILQKDVVKRVEEFVGSLFQSLPRQSQSLLAVLALLGRPVSIPVLRRVTGIRDLSAALDSLIERDIAACNREGVSLRHDLIREAAYRRIPPFTRSRLHRRAAAALRKSEKWVGEAAQHFFKGGLRTLAFEHALSAAARTDSFLAFDESISFLKLALRARPSRRAEILPLLAERLYRIHRLSDAHGALNSAFRASVPRSIELEILDLELRYSLGKIDGVSLRSAIKDVKDRHNFHNPSQVLALLKLEARSAHHDGDKDACSRSHNELRDLGTMIGGPEGLEAIAYAARGRSILDSAVEGEEWVVEALNSSDGIPENEAGIRTMGLYGSIMYELGKLAAAENIHLEALSTAERIGAISEWPLLGAHAHMLMVEQGKYGAASKLASEIRHRVLPSEAGHSLVVVAANEAAMYYELLDFENAERLSNEALHYLTNIKSIWIELEVTGLRGLIFWAQGRRTEARLCEETAQTGVARLGYRCGDTSYIEILSSKFENFSGAREKAILRLQTAIFDYRERDLVCRLRMELELANLKKTIIPAEARSHANTVYAEATRIGARPLAEAADALLLRI